MEPIQLFIEADKPDVNNQWNAELTAALKRLHSVEQVLIIEENERSHVELFISYQMEELPIREIEQTVSESGTNILSMNVRFPSGISGIADPYRASAFAPSLNEAFSQIAGICSAAISSKGTITVTLSTAFEDKQSAMNEVLKHILQMKASTF
jgi:hypothetical protein